MSLEIEIANQQSCLPLDEQWLAKAARHVLAGEGFLHGALSLAVVNDARIHELNRRYLNHDYPTDVLSFLFASRAGHLEGEVIASAETAVRAARELGGDPRGELLLYVVHGCLHLAGYDDQTEETRAIMRERETHYLSALGHSAKEAPP